MAAPGYVWFRFWMLKTEQLVRSISMMRTSYRHVCTGLYALLGGDDGLVATDLILGLWILTDGHVMVLNEDEYETGCSSGLITKDEAKEAEQRIRDMTLATAKRGSFRPPSSAILNSIGTT
jgi:predicted RNA-binding protein associated with RNAse of E/G family